MIRLSALAVAAAISLSPAVAAPALDELRIGVMGQSWIGPGSDKEQTASYNIEALFRSPRFLSIIGAPRPHIGATIAGDFDATSQLYAGLEWDIQLTDKFFLAASVGGTIHNGETGFDPVADMARANDTVFLGCRVLFRYGGDIGYAVTDRLRASIHFDHISNAGLCAVNEGLDNAGLRLGYSF